MIQEKILEKINNKYGFVMSFVFLILCFLLFWGMSDRPEMVIEVNSKKYNIEVADTYGEKITGLSNHESLCEKCGMLFVYEKPGIYNFWMKDMDFPIDIIWLNENKEIIFIKENLSPDTYPKSFGTNLKSKYILEFNAGFSKEHGLKFGDSINF